VESRHAPVALVDGALRPAGPLDRIRGRRVLLLCGLARPEGFRRTAAALGATVAAERIYPDHHRYTEGEVVEALLAAQAARCELVLTTEKDAVRIPAKLADDPRLRCVRISAELVAGAEALDAALGTVLGTVLGSATAEPSTSGRPG
jgi:tetraacyldisaccharide 4'-kinase